LGVTNTPISVGRAGVCGTSEEAALAVRVSTDEELLFLVAFLYMMISGMLVLPFLAGALPLPS